MPKICYEHKKFSPEKLELLARANMVIMNYQQQGFTLTLRQLYYQFIANNLFPQSWANTAGVTNSVQSYNRLGNLISDGRMAGLIDWEAIVDRGRTSYANTHWARPSQILEATVKQYAIDRWANQPYYLEVWVEKEALEDVLGRACQPMDVRFFACKGYTSQSAMWEASQRLVDKLDQGKKVVIIHLGDHDPSGVDMSRDIEERLSLFCRQPVPVNRIALNWAQIQQFNPPPNPAKTTDSRYQAYEDKYGTDSWELDALDPAVLVNLIRKEILRYRSETLWEAQLAIEERGRTTLDCVVKYFPDVVEYLRQRRKMSDEPVVCQQCGAKAGQRCLCGVGNQGRQLS